MFNNVILAKNEKFMCADISNLYFNNHKYRYDYMKPPIDIIPDGIIHKYKLQYLAHIRFLHMEMQKSMYVLPQEGKISNDKLKLHLPKFVYETSPITPGLLWHQTRHLHFSLVVDYFGVKYKRQADITHLLDVLKTIYNISEEWGGNLYCGIILYWY